MIKFQDVTKEFSRGVAAIANLTLEIDNGEFVFITGPSGGGKTTLLRLLLREILPTKGSIFVGDQDITTLRKWQIPLIRRKIGAAFQDFKLLNDRTVFENIALALEILGADKEKIKKDACEAIQLVGLEGKEGSFPAQLAGGEIQRAVIARAIIGNPEILFADEPTGNLDPTTAWQIINLLLKINSLGKTVIVATHNFDIVDALEKRVVWLEKGKITKDKKKGKYKK